MNVREWLPVLARADELEVALHVEAIPTRNLVLRARLFGDLVILGVNLLIASRGESSLGGAEDHLAARAALTRIRGLHLGVLRSHLRGSRPPLHLPVWPLS